MTRNADKEFTLETNETRYAPTGRGDRCPGLTSKAAGWLMLGTMILAARAVAARSGDPTAIGLALGGGGLCVLAYGATCTASKKSRAAVAIVSIVLLAAAVYTAVVVDESTLEADRPLQIAGVQVNDLFCVRDTSELEAVAPDRVYEVTGLSRANPERPVVWLDWDPDSTWDQRSEITVAALLDIADEVDDDEFEPGDPC